MSNLHGICYCFDIVVTVLRLRIIIRKTSHKIELGDPMRMARVYGFVFLLGTVGYGLLELMYRGRTHWTMVCLGGLSFLILFVLRQNMQPTGRLVRCLAGCVAITVLELLVGSIVNCRMRWMVWDYSGLAYNVRGQICPGFTMLWLGLCYPADMLCGALLRKLSWRRSSRGCRWRLPLQSNPDASGSAGSCIPQDWRRNRIRSEQTGIPQYALRCRDRK